MVGRVVGLALLPISDRDLLTPYRTGDDSATEGVSRKPSAGSAGSQATWQGITWSMTAG